MPNIAILVPTYNEAENLPPLLERLLATIREHKLDAEIVILDDDSKDGTAEIAQQLAKDHPVRVVVRKNERGLASAVIQGFDRTTASILVVCDADLSHPVEAIPKLVLPLLRQEAEMSIGSRYVHGGKTVGWPWHRQFASRFAAGLARPLTSVKDPMSGFFAIRREVLQRSALAPIGYKIGLEIIVRCGVKTIVEVPITFTERQFGASKFGLREIWNYLRHLHRLSEFKKPNLTEFIRFCFVGGLGFLIDLLVFSITHTGFGLSYKLAQVISCIFAITNNFLWNKHWTFRGPRHGKVHSQYLIYFVMAMLSLGLRTLLMHGMVDEWMWPVYPSFIIAILMTMLLNFLVIRSIVFRKLVD